MVLRQQLVLLAFLLLHCGFSIAAKSAKGIITAKEENNRPGSGFPPEKGPPGSPGSPAAPPSPPADQPLDGITHDKTLFPDEFRPHHLYLKPSQDPKGGPNDETVILHTSEEEVYISNDHGKNWRQVLDGQFITRVVPHKYASDIVFFLTNSKDGFWSIDRGRTISGFTAPNDPVQAPSIDPLSFHPQNLDWIVWTGFDPGQCSPSFRTCPSDAYYSTNRGADWRLLKRSVRRCEFIAREGNEKKDAKADALLVCLQNENENPSSKRLHLISTEDWFAHQTDHYDSVLDFATMAEFLMVATRDANSSLHLDASTDGKTFAHAKFPHNLDYHYTTAYTILDSSSHSVYLHVTESNERNREYGSLLTSNSNGTSYVNALGGVSRNRLGFVDFEKMASLEGVSLANVVANLDDVRKRKTRKQLKTLITHNAAAEWSLITPPEKDSNGEKYECHGRSLADCSLNLHGYTERLDVRQGYSSPLAVGLMLALGDVGPSLRRRSESSLFMTRDAGITWHEVRKGIYAWEFGDRGSIIVTVAQNRPTKTLLYSLDEGETWAEHVFSDVSMKVDSVTSLPSDSSRNFIIWGRDTGSLFARYAAVNVDFTKLKERSRQCAFNHEEPEANDYYLWEPKHPSQKDNCLFGHVARYNRKRIESKCYNNASVPLLSHTEKNCECTRQDYECDYNYERQSDGSCALVPGLSPANAQDICTNDPAAVEWYEPTPYRKLPLSTCEGGLQLDHIKAHPCPNKDEEFKKRHPGISGIGLFFAITVPITFALAVGYWVYAKWDGKFGHIRLGEMDSGVRGGLGHVFGGDGPVARAAVVVVSGIAAAVQALPLLASSLWRSLRSRLYGVPPRDQRPYTSRGAFAARRGDYVGVADDEDELLGPDLEDDEEHVTPGA